MSPVMMRAFQWVFQQDKENMIVDIIMVYWTVVQMAGIMAMNAVRKITLNKVLFKFHAKEVILCHLIIK